MQDPSAAPPDLRQESALTAGPVRRLPQRRLSEPAPARPAGAVQRLGLWLRDRQALLSWLQGGMVLLYALVLLLPVLLLEGGVGRIAQLLIWGLWAPGVLLSVLLLGRLWCGAVCPEGALTALASRHGRGRAIPRWMRWPGWPFASFAVVTVYGQMISVWHFPLPALLLLGGSTSAAVLVGLLYGREKRVWCRYLCPVNGLFGLLARLAPLRFAVDAAAWDSCPPERARGQRFICEPMVPVRTMDSASPCHMCGRCAGFRDAVRLEARLPGVEVVRGGGATGWDGLLVILGMIGLGTAAFHWNLGPWHAGLRQALAQGLTGIGWLWPLEAAAPWWLLTGPPGSGLDRMVDVAALLGVLAGMTACLSLMVALPLALATRLLGPWEGRRFHHLAQGLIPLAAAGLILGAGRFTVKLLRDAGWDATAAPLGLALLALGAGWSMVLIALSVRRHATGTARGRLATGAALLALLPPLATWTLLVRIG